MFPEQNPRPFAKNFRGTECWGGWFLALLLGGFILPKAYRHFYLRLPSVQRSEWNEIMVSKRAALGMPWGDQRPLIVIAGDSHIEMGDWYDYFGGAFAIRNCGLSRAKIQDVNSLVQSIADRNPETVVLMCGCNNLTQEDSVETCTNLYNELLYTVHSRLHPQYTVVLSVMPLRATALDVNARAINDKIVAFDKQLEQLCKRNEARFVDVNTRLVDPAGGLQAGLTTDGLHLDQEGYRLLASEILPVLSGLHAKP